jgi:hypothetical protein
MNRLRWISRSALAIAFAYAAAVGGVLQEYAPDDVPEAAREAGVALPLADPNVYVSTRRGTLELRDGDVVVARYDCGFGASPVFGRIAADARSTPLGEYRIVAAERTREFGGRGARFLRLDWPNVDDAARALDLGVISRDDYDAIAAAATAGLPPPTDTPLGGPIGIQGGLFFFHARHATDGSVGLANADVVELFGYLPVGTRVEIGD